MHPPDPKEEKLFDAARRIPDPSARTHFLDTSCGAESELRSRVEELLAANDEADSFFADSALIFEDFETIDMMRSQLHSATYEGVEKLGQTETVGHRIDRYTLTRKIGEGGCGVVFLAEQEEPVRRKVALKIIRGGIGTKSVIARFEAERQALAMMDHPNIARVFDAGETDSGLPYFVMEHVRGVRITDYCDQNRLGVEERLNLFIQVCHAIQHAHQNCIVHGDIKPSNIMISQHDGIPIPKVIDFGISKATEARRGDRDRQVSASQLVGTPAYMSPEQVETGGLEIDTRSDIYSLGVLLYELLTGQTPLDSRALAEAELDEIRRAFKEQTIPKPRDRVLGLEADKQERIAACRGLSVSRFLSLLQGDLTCIVMKALQADRRKRYETANALAVEIVRYMQNEPVVAHPSNWFYRTRKLIRRNRGFFLAGGSVAVALVLGTTLSTWLFLKERDARQRAVSAEQQQARLRLEAETRESLTQAALLVSQERYEEADALISGISLNESTVEGAAVFRAIGEWHALNRRWKLSADRFQVLLRINHLEGADVSSLDYLELGPVLMELGDLAAFDQFREAAIARFAGKQNPFTDRIMKISLLHATDAEMLESLEPLARLNAEAAEEAAASGDSFSAAWRSLSMALYEYRSGRLESAVDWSMKCLGFPDKNFPREAAVRTILAMSHFRLGDAREARTHLNRAHELVDNWNRQGLGRGSPVHGFWFDWAFANVLLREASAMMERPRPISEFAEN